MVIFKLPNLSHFIFSQCSYDFRSICLLQKSTVGNLSQQVTEFKPHFSTTAPCDLGKLLGLSPHPFLTYKIRARASKIFWASKMVRGSRHWSCQPNSLDLSTTVPLHVGHGHDTRACTLPFLCFPSPFSFPINNFLIKL